MFVVTDNYILSDTRLAEIYSEGNGLWRVWEVKHFPDNSIHSIELATALAGGLESIKIDGASYHIAKLALLNHNLSKDRATITVSQYPVSS